MKCDVSGCEKKAVIFFDRLWFCEEHGEDWINLPDYVRSIRRRLRKKWVRKNVRRK